MTRDRNYTITVDGRPVPAGQGDTVASALIADGVRSLGFSPYLNRPHAIWGIGSGGACAHVQVESGPGEPMVPATTVETYPGLRVRSLHGRGEVSLPESDDGEPRHDHTWAHCDVLVVGGGPAGLAAARAAADTRARVMIVDDAPDLGGHLRHAPRRIHGRSALDWVRHTAEELREHGDVQVLTRTTVTGQYHHGELIALERRTDHRAPATIPTHMARHRLWHIRARQVVLATGSMERPLAFAGNDRPGVMLAGAAVGYAWAHSAPPGERAVVMGAHNEALVAARHLAEAGVDISAVVDARTDPGPAGAALLDELWRGGAQILQGHAVTETRDPEASGAVTAVRVAPIDGSGRARGEETEVPCDLVAVSGGFDPCLALWTQVDGGTRYDPAHAAFLPEESAAPATVRCAGAARGTRDLDAALAEGAAVGHAAAEQRAIPTRPTPAEPVHHPRELWLVTTPHTVETEVLVDPHRDATLADVRAALDANLRSIEHVKRHTTIGTGPEQGRAWGVLASAVVGQLLDTTPEQLGTPRRRAPLAPIPLATVAGRDRGDFFDPIRRTPMHQWHLEQGAVFEDIGQWRRARYYPRWTADGQVEDMAAAVRRECRSTRESVGMLDASTLGKILVEGADAPEFLDRIYANMMSTLRIGKCRYGVICGADGMVRDDGVCVRLAEDRYLVTTTSGNADSTLAWLEEWQQTEWPQLRVQCTPVTEHWATISVVGPRSREVLGRLAPGLDVTATGFEFMGMRNTEIAGVPGLVLRVSFSGELTYEINVPSWYGLGVWEAVLEAGAPYDITPYGTETMHVLRAEKGFIVVGHETDGQVSVQDAGLGWAVSTRKDFVGKRSLARADLARDDREQLVALVPADGATVVAEGAQLITHPAPEPPVPMVGHVTSSYDSPALGTPFSLALLSGGRGRHGERLYAYHLGQTVPVQVTDPVLYDREGTRRDG
ncbi:glycine cleavage T C-terminal barrel domain-containing protein [Lipingzhangella sp. LS1_29]|uniref:Glycine cleavage T C-terminal barrel domain-containing protein n=1 Tax=Lipingzhangella rawalii TaxID=2055835 RepID=A0ABU2H2R2_9ACTN|nr:FAD-dependent oxidoreductase [Lipingzhangella rawalii]MDS1269592.1 glycine cleavage T C-terminal barrel domain-containing protein [Lipingzhangella rawalii]